jgi:hypothetical protein
MKVIGRIIKCMEKELLNGQMEEFMKATMLKIKNKVWVKLLGLMVELIKECGKMVCSMVWENIREKIIFGNKVNGKMGKD